MIPRRYIDEWKPKAPWLLDSQVEQDLVISRTLVSIFSNDFLSERLAFRGGTALYKLYLKSQPRYSEDIDLVQIKPEPVKETLRQLRGVMQFLGDPVVKQKASNNTLIFGFDSEIAPVMRLKLKIEINCREHFSVLGYAPVPFMVESGWFTGKCTLLTYHLDELLGTKLRALYQRKKGRDLYDLFKALLTERKKSERILQCYYEYMISSVKKTPTQKEFLLNLDEKMNDPEFLNDISALLIPQEDYNPVEAFNVVKTELIERME